MGVSGVVILRDEMLQLFDHYMYILFMVYESECAQHKGFGSTWTAMV